MSTELMEYKEFVKYAVLAGAISLSRVDLKKKVCIQFLLFFYINKDSYSIIH
jgi:hypothetical protein